MNEDTESQTAPEEISPENEIEAEALAVLTSTSTMAKRKGA
jgi:hypothetical protein